MADDYKAQLLAVEAKLSKDPENEELLTLKSDLIELIELSSDIAADEQLEQQKADNRNHNNRSKHPYHQQTNNNNSSSQQSPSTSSNHGRQTRLDLGDGYHKTRKNDCTKDGDDDHHDGSSEYTKLSCDTDTNTHGANTNTNNNNKRQLSEAELLAKRREKNKKKREKLREKTKEQLDAAESVKQSWQSFANQKGLKGLTKKSIFASPHSVTGKVGVGTNGIADAPSAGGASSASSSAAPMTKHQRRY